MKLKKYFKLYSKSLQLIFKADAKVTLLILLIVPIQYLIPTLNVWVSNVLINLVAQQQFSAINFYLIVWSVLFVLNNLTVPLNVFLQGQLTDKLTLHLNTSLMDKAKAMKTIELFEDAEFYDDINVIQSEASWRPVNLIVFGSSVIGNLITLISMLWLLVDFHLVIALAILIVLIPQGMMFYKIQQQAFETLVSNSPESRKLNYYGSLSLSNQAIKEVKMYQMHGFIKNKYLDTYKKIIVGVKNNRLKQFSISITFLFVTALISVGGFIYVLNGVTKGVFAAGSILIFSSAIVFTMQSMSRVIEESSLLYDTLLYMERYFNFMATPITSSHQAIPIPSFSAIRVNNLSFHYPNTSENVLKQVSFDIEKGQKIAIVGENGSGKTTLVKLLCGLYQAPDNAIKIDDININALDMTQYRSLITTVFQDYCRYNFTLKENVNIADLTNTSKTDIVTALTKSGFYPEKATIPLEQQLGKIFANATDLSGGEWQKIALARAFFANKELLILDEPTAAIDAKLENEIYKQFLELASGKTVIFVTHRLSSVKKADKVLLIKQGEVLAFSSHDELMQTNDYYRELYQLQAEPYSQS
ncbi:ABC transporter ATP-binding protein [Tuanshanicoccus lijuaniae]|uniref:ABC transporter ATP-binding protein n=1 Tax=Aerococcaceae bacterium zg-1292 TaxID=2774330 RepID=UPI0019360781|nr:ABC transporter ATP-binding protein [Aerococcaceae bacterium zg-1292]QQA37298.1 ABC transporter ATP-binding protein [Aerococcaceae bacterium zg-1292]